MDGELINERKYDPFNINGQKMLNEIGSHPTLYPFDEWDINDSRPILLVEGEKDAINARERGLNALTHTGGALAFPALFGSFFKDKQVYILYDNDKAGEQGAINTASLLVNAGVEQVYICHWNGILQEKEDITDFFIKYKQTANDLEQLIQQTAHLFSKEEAIKQKNLNYKQVDVADIANGNNVGHFLTSTVMLSGRLDEPMRTPSTVHFTCTGGDDKFCSLCPLKDTHSKWWILSEKNSHQMLELIEQPNKSIISKKLRMFIGVPEKCDLVTQTIMAEKRVDKVVLIPDFDSKSRRNVLDNTQSYSQITAYLLEAPMQDGTSYRIYYKAFAHPTQKQRVVAVVHEVTPADNIVNTFKITENIQEQLKHFQGHPVEKMQELYERATDIHRIFEREMFTWAVDLVYHSPLQFYFNNWLIKKGYPEILIIGETRTGKSETLEHLQDYYGLGERMEGRRATRAGLIGGLDRLPSGATKIEWGRVVLNHKGLLAIDEASGITQDIWAQMTDVRSSGIASLDMIGKGIAPAMTRLIWLSNTRVQSNKQTLPLMMYPTGVEPITELIGSAEDISRFDLILLGAKEEITKEYTPLDNPLRTAFPNEYYRNAILWAWTRPPERIKWDIGVEQYIVVKSKELNDRFNTDIALLGTEAWKKIARLSVALATRLISTDNSFENVIVKKEHVDWVINFILRAYISEVFRLDQYIKAKRMYTAYDIHAEIAFKGIIAQYPTVVKVLSENNELSQYQLSAISGLDKQEFNKLIANLTSNYFIQFTTDKIRPSFRFRKALDAYRKNFKKENLVPLKQRDEPL